MGIEILERWKKAVIHLDYAVESSEIAKLKEIHRLATIKEKIEKWKELSEKLTKETIKVRFRGTALFLIHNKRRYLLTARHVVFDETLTEREYWNNIAQARSKHPEEEYENIERVVEENTQDLIFNEIFRVQSINEKVKEDSFYYIRIFATDHEGHDYAITVPEFLSHLNLGSSSMSPYTFSSPEIDLAIISLDQRNPRFADHLIERGYEPISSEDISDEPTQEGNNVFTIGFPASTSFVKQLNLKPEEELWSSNFISTPVFTFGKISMLNEQLNFFWTDMSIYPGNSGGPVIEDDKLVGVVSAQPLISSASHTQVKIGMPFGKIIKAKYINELLRIQEEKDKLFAEKSL